MTPAQLTSELDGLCHGERVRRMVALGRKSREEPTVRQLLADLEAGGFYERFLSLLACPGSGDGERALRAMTDPSRTIRGRALRLLAQLSDDKQVVRGLTVATRELLKPFLARLRRARRFAPIDKFLDTLAAKNDRRLETLAPFGSGKAVQRHLAVGLERGGRDFWRRLARYHPSIAVTMFRQQIPSGERVDSSFTWMCFALFPVLCKRVPDESLALAKDLVEVVDPTHLSWLPLMRRRPSETADLLLSLRGLSAGDGCFNRLAHRLDRERLLALAHRDLIDLRQAVVGVAWRPGRPYRWLAALPPKLRGEVFTACRERHAGGILPVDLLMLLPEKLRQMEARRHLALAALATQPATRLTYASLLPWEEAMALAEPFLRHPEAALRAAAMSALALAVPLQRQHAGDYLVLVRARRNEQDPVRLAMMGGLVRAPAAVWREEHLDALGAVLRDALDATDLSGATFTQANLLVLRLLRRHPDWAARWLTTLVKERGQIGWHQLENLLGDADVEVIGPVLLPVLRAWRKTERDGQTLQLASALGRRLRAFPELIDLVEHIVRGTRRQMLAGHGLGLLFQHARNRLPELVPQLLREDPSWIVFALVSHYLHRRRQDLLTPFLGRRPFRGRFHTGKTRFVLPLTAGFERWSKSQQETFALTLNEVLDLDPMRDTPSICQALRQRAALPAVPSEPVIARAGDERPAIRDTALRLLGRLDAGQGVGTLIEALSDDRARIAIYALRQALLAMPEAHALDLLRQAPRDKVTVAKEVVRLVGEFDSDTAFEVLEAVESSKPHRDVHVALLRAVWSHLDRPAAWAMIDRAVQSGIPELMTTVVRIPSDRLSVEGRRRLAVLLAGLMRHPDLLVRMAVLTRCGEQPPEDPRRTLLPRLLEAVGSSLPGERNAAVRAAVMMCTSSDAGRMARAARELKENRRALLALVEWLRTLAPRQRRRIGPVARGVADALADDPLLATVRLPLALAALGPRKIEPFLAELDSAGWRPDVLMLAAATLECSMGHLERSDMKRLEEALTASPSPALRRLGLSALLAQTRSGGWDEASLTRLRALLGDPDPLVASAAQWTLPAEEEKPGTDAV